MSDIATPRDIVETRDGFRELLGSWRIDLYTHSCGNSIAVGFRRREVNRSNRRIVFDEDRVFILSPVKRLRRPACG